MKQMPEASMEKNAQEHDHEAEAAAEALMRAHEIKSNPELLKRAAVHVHKKLRAITGLKKDISSIKGLKDHYNDKFGSGKKPPEGGLEE